MLNGTDLASRAEVVIVAGTEDFVYDDLRNAGLAVRRGADFVATGRDPTYPQPDGFWPGTGALLAAVETVSERKAEIVGKPNPQLILTALDRLGEGRTLVVGDRADADLAAAASAELDAALVKTGGQDERDAADGRPRAGGRGRVARRAHPALSRRSTSPGSTPTSRHASASTSSPAPAAAASAAAGSSPRASWRWAAQRAAAQPGAAVAVHRHRPPPPQLASQQREQLLERRRRSSAGSTGTWRQPRPATS